jgi:hypothetical protein
MKRALFALLLLAAPLDPAAAQSKTFSGCTTFSCHTATFTVSQIAPVEAYGQTWTRHLNISWTHYFSALGGFFGSSSPSLAPYHFPTPHENGFFLDRFWDFWSWNQAGTCFSGSCVGLFTDRNGGIVDNNWEITTAAVTVYRGAPMLGSYLGNFPPETVTLTLVPEPSTWALLTLGLVVIGTATRVRRRALR